MRPPHTHRFRHAPALLAAAVALALATPAAGAIVFQEDFSDNTAGWTLGPEWQIGSATASTGHATGFGDPDTDHTPTSDNGVAGVIIGGNASNAVHSFYYLESPSIDLTGAATANLVFQRWLNSDYPPYMTSRVEVYNGSAWVVLWETTGPPAILDAAWSEQAFDVTAYRNAGFRVRFGFQIGSGGVMTMSGWNVDDVVIFNDCTDDDDDGYGSSACGGPDCDDTDAAVHPGAAEVCNGIDDNCNGQVDEGVGYTFYPDADGDGWGLAGSPNFTCSSTPPPGHVEQPGDCDDGNAAIHPAAIDLCDGIDNNCNGAVDDSTAYWYLDADGDGWGGFDPSPIVSCTPIAGRATAVYDCDDTRADVHPGAPELLDGIDNDCNGLVDEGFENPIIRSIRDVPNDQGRAVRLRWRRHVFDQPGSVSPISSYSIYRQVAPGQSAARPARRARLASPAGAQALPPGEWDLLATLAATTDSSYQTVVPTLCDSNSTAFCRGTFVVRAHFQTPGQFGDSAPDSGWSVDNIAPGVPAGLAANAVAGGVELSWTASGAADFQYFRVYRGNTAGFEPGPGSLVHATATTSWTDASPGTGSVHYKVTAVDANGNESAPAGALATVDAGAAFRPTVFGFATVAPNPFSHAVGITFDLPDAALVTLAVHDVAGRRVRTLVHEPLKGARYTRTWDAYDERGNAVPPGIYLLRLEAAGRTLTRRIVLVR